MQIIICPILIDLAAEYQIISPLIAAFEKSFYDQTKVLSFMIEKGIFAMDFVIESIPRLIQSQMRNVTWHSDCPVPLSQLAYVTLQHWGVDEESHSGVLIINELVAKEILIIFKKLYEARFPIESVKPMYLFQGDDEASMQANNTSGFNCRRILGIDHKFSHHAYGLAIDINPLFNPYVKQGLVLPKNASAYVNRDQRLPGMIDHKSLPYQLFKDAGWQWGGDWQTLKDYQHFEKPLVE